MRAAPQSAICSMYDSRRVKAGSKGSRDPLFNLMAGMELGLESVLEQICGENEENRVEKEGTPGARWFEYI